MCVPCKGTGRDARCGPQRGRTCATLPFKYSRDAATAGIRDWGPRLSAYRLSGLQKEYIFIWFYKKILALGIAKLHCFVNRYEQIVVVL